MTGGETGEKPARPAGAHSVKAGAAAANLTVGVGSENTPAIDGVKYAQQIWSSRMGAVKDHAVLLFDLDVVARFFGSRTADFAWQLNEIKDRNSRLDGDRSDLLPLPDDIYGDWTLPDVEQLDMAWRHRARAMNPGRTIPPDRRLPERINHLLMAVHTKPSRLYSAGN